MQIIKAGYQLVNEPSITKKIERIARICYKSEDKIGEGTDSKMITDLLKRQHYAMLEHGDVCMEVSDTVYDLVDDAIHTIENNLSELNGVDMLPKKIFLRRTMTTLKDGNVRYVISGNIRAWYEFFLEAAPIGALLVGMYSIVNEQLNHLLDTTPLADMEIGIDCDTWEFDQDTAFFRFIEDVSTLTPIERMVHETISILFTVDRGVTHELVRMRDCSFAQESTRYCNYSLGKYGREITVIEPLFFAEANRLDNPTEIWAERYGAWREGCEQTEIAYFRIMDTKAPAQQARDVLPTSVKADIVMTTNLIEWRHIFSLRACDSTGPAHPQMKEVMIPAFKEIRGTHQFAFGDMIAADEVNA